MYTHKKNLHLVIRINFVVHWHTKLNNAKDFQKHFRSWKSLALLQPKSYQLCTSSSKNVYRIHSVSY